MLKKMTMGSGSLLCLAVLLLPGRAIGQEHEEHAAQLYAQAIALSAQATVASTQAIAADDQAPVSLNCSSLSRIQVTNGAPLVRRHMLQ